VRSGRLVVAHSDEGLEHLVLGHDALQLAQRLGLAQGLVHHQLVGVADGDGHGGIQQIAETVEAELLEHLLLVRALRAHVSGLELIQRGEDITGLGREGPDRGGRRNLAAERNSLRLRRHEQIHV
jgi:hypothetical protein